MRHVALMLLCVFLVSCGVKGPLKRAGDEESPEKHTREWNAKPSSYGH